MIIVKAREREGGITIAAQKHSLSTTEAAVGS